MAEPTLDRDPVELLADEFTARLRGGERPSIEEYAERIPECASQVRELFPAIAAMEQWKSQRESRSGGRVSLGPTRLKQLGDFRIIREIGRGGMGIVYEAEQLSLGRRVAVKVLPKQALLDEKHLLRFRREAKTAAKLHHTNIVPVLGVGEHDGFHFIVMQYIPGVGIDDLIPQLTAIYGARLGRSDDQALTPEQFGTHQRTSRGREWESRVDTVARALARGNFRKATAAGDDSSSGSSSVLTSGSSGRLAAVDHSSDALSGSALSGDSLSIASAEASVGADSQAAPRAASTPTIDMTGVSQRKPETPVDDAPVAAPDAAQAPPTPRLPLSSAYWRSVANIGLQVADALQYAHNQGTLHRDIKPANLLVDERGIVWVADFGLAKAMEHDDVSRTGDIVGTLRYMAPEQIAGKADPRSDVFSLGLTLYELLTFRPAYDENERKRALMKHTATADPAPPRRFSPHVPRDLETIILKAMDPEPARRYATAGEMAEDLHRFLEDRPIRARRATPVEHLWRWCRRNPAVASLSGLALLLLTTIAVMSSIGYARTAVLNQQVSTALEREKHQHQQADLARRAADDARHKAEVTSELAWSALDRIVARFAPRRTMSPEPFTVETDEGEQLEMVSQPVLSKETAILLQELLNFYDRLAEEGDNTTAYQLRIAEANRRVGDIQQRLGRLEQAESAYRKAIEIFAPIAANSPADVRAATQMASAHNELGKILRLTRRGDDAHDAFDRARDILKPLVEQGNEPEPRYELARTYYLQSMGWLGGGPGPGDPRRRGPEGGPGRSKSGRGGRDGFREAERPGGPDGGRLAGPEVRRAFENPFDRQREQLAQAIELLEPLTAEYPALPDYQQLLAMLYLERAKGQFRDQDEQARVSVDQAVGILTQLVERYPGNPDYQFALSLAYVIEPLELPDDMSQADALVATYLEQRNKSLAILRTLNQEHPHVPDYQLAQVPILGAMGLICRQAGRDWDAERHFRRALMIQETVARRHPDVPAYKMRADFMRHPYIEFLMDRFEETGEIDLLHEVAGQLEITATGLEAVAGTADQDDHRMQRFRGFLRHKVARNYERLAELFESAGDSDGQATALAHAAQLRAGNEAFENLRGSESPYGRERSRGPDGRRTGAPGTDEGAPAETEPPAEPAPPTSSA